MRTMEAENVIEMLHITKEFPGIIANDDITLQLRRGEIHALLGENGAGKSTLMSVLFGLYQPEAGEIKKNGKVVKINNPNDATALGIGMVHQHFQLVDVFTVLDNIILGAEPTKLGFLQKKEARKKVEALSEKYGLKVDLDARVENITVHRDGGGDSRHRRQMDRHPRLEARRGRAREAAAPGRGHSQARRGPGRGREARDRGHPALARRHFRP